MVDFEQINAGWESSITMADSEPEYASGNLTLHFFYKQLGTSSSPHIC